MKRRTLIAGAAGLVAASGLGAAIGFSPARAAPIYRAAGTHTRLPEGIQGGESRSAGARTLHYFPFPVQRLRFVIPTFYTRSQPTPVQDVDVAGDMDFQIAVESRAKASMAGLAPRKLVTFDGEEVARYTAGEGPFGYLVSDVVDLGAVLPPGEPLGVFTVQEWRGGVSPGENMMPRNTFIGAGAKGFFEVQRTSKTDSLVEANWARDATDLGDETVHVANVFTPYILAEVSPLAQSVLILGTSSAFGVGDTQGGTGQFSAARGDAFGNRGWPERWLHRKLGLAFGNIAKPSDRMSWMADPANCQRRLALAKVLNPTHMLFQHGPNDMGRSTVEEMSAYAEAIIGNFREQVPGLKVVPATITPRSESDGGWLAADGSDQRPMRGGGLGETGAIWNDRVVRLGEIGPFTEGGGQFVDPAAAIEMAPVNSFKFLADGVTPMLSTPDGVHLTGDGAERIVNLLEGNPFG